MFQKNIADKIYFMLINASTGAALTGATVTAKVSKDGAAQSTAAGSVTEIGNGQYVLAATTADMNANTLGFNFTATSAVPVSVTVSTVDFPRGAIPAVAAGASGGLPTAVDASGRVDVLKINGTSQTSRDLGASVLLSNGTGAGQISLTSGAVILTVTPPTAAQVAAVILSNTTNKLATDASGFITYNNAAPPSSSTIAGAILSNVSNKLVTDGSGFVKISSGQGSGQLTIVSGTVDANIVDVNRKGIIRAGSDPFDFDSLLSFTNDYEGQLLDTGFTGSVGGDVNGKVLGGGISAITGVGVNVNLVSINAHAVTATAGFSFDALSGFTSDYLQGQLAVDITGGIGGSIAGNIEGKVLGSGAGVITGVGVNAGNVTLAASQPNFAPSITIVSPIATDGTISLNQGDDYKAVDSRAIVITLAGFPTLIGAGVVIHAVSTFDATVVSIAGTVTSSTSVQFEIAHALTAALSIGAAAYEYQMIATLADASVVTLQRGFIDVLE